MIIVFAMHMASLSMFRFLASAFRTMVACTTAGSFAILIVMLFGGFIIPRREYFQVIANVNISFTHSVLFYYHKIW